MPQKQSTSRTGRHGRQAARLAGLLLWSGLAVSLAAHGLDANSGNKENHQLSVGTSSMDDVARMIRQNKQWEILDARQRHKGSETRYRFKVINNTGKVKVINIDPRRPNLRKLEQ